MPRKSKIDIFSFFLHCHLLCSFEQEWQREDKHQRSAVTINITGLGQTTVEPTVLEAEDITDVSNV